MYTRKLFKFLGVIVACLIAGGAVIGGLLALFAFHVPIWDFVIYGIGILFILGCVVAAILGISQ